MKEAFLHQIWKLKRFSHQKLSLTNGCKLEILNPGWLNHESGPDFFNGSIRIDGIQWNGNIEIHIKSSDWYAHKHELDKAYNNVILHVVYEHDQDVKIDNECIPTLELKPILDQHEWSTYLKFINSPLQIPCEKSIQFIDAIHIQEQVQRMFVQRLERKAEMLLLRLKEINNNQQQLLYEEIAKIFGSKVNALPFLELTQRLPLSILLREQIKRRITLTLGVAGFLEEQMEDLYFQSLKEEWKFLKNKYNLNPMDKLAWKFFGVRPQSYPPFKLVQFAVFLNELIGFTSVKCSVSNAVQILKLKLKKCNEIPHFWKIHYHFGKTIKTHSTELSIDFIHSYFINVYVPFLWLNNYLQNTVEKNETSIQLLEKIPPENNKISRFYKKIGIEIKSSADSQGLLELKHEFCDKKLCLSCTIGTKILQT